MAGRGPAPKDPSKRVRANKDVIPLRVVEAVVAPQPQLPEFNIRETNRDGITTYDAYRWPQITVDWWALMAQHPLAPTFIDTDWQYLLDTARIHAAFWEGDLKLGPELRLREAKYGFTPEDRLRLRLTFAQTNEAEDKAQRRRELGADSRQRRGGFAG
jgi:hypothetical protein